MQPSPIRRPHFSLLSIAIALLACVVAVAAAPDSKTLPSYSFRSATDEDTAEDRAFDFSAKAKGLVTWFKQKKTDKLFDKFKVGSIKSDVLENSQFKLWADAVSKANKKNPEAGELLMASTLTARYGDDGRAKILISAKNVYGLEATTQKLEKAQLTNWLAKGKTADDVFKLLKLDWKSEEFIKTPAFRTWLSYVNNLNQKNPDDFRAIEVVLKNYDQIELLVSADVAWESMRGRKEIRK
ncbi:hypothetical protein PR003_g22855 [Phytophthora rubi]|uniref:RxLR effector PexRD54 WY domain-containing protein n=1 Tax=Phytophthora rubi TaxID=129364 RepID=A0A6A3J4K5_9STRA|nr:hypothetical protein PR002_g22086 [Phytophthora rubi]KAE8989496.1 hypothetical protein PR001_g21759 [Phytophthora rubi]KAE9299969.1 hypothetical protein PR003_g22855 [Phytophthora rubi]